MPKGEAIASGSSKRESPKRSTIECSKLPEHPGRKTSREATNALNPVFNSEIIETFGEGAGETEVCATAETQYDSAAQKLFVELDSFARCVCASGTREHETPPWLPTAEHVIEHLAHDEADTGQGRRQFGADHEDEMKLSIFVRP